MDTAPLAGRLRWLCPLAALIAAAPAASAQTVGVVAGQIKMLEKGDRPSSDVGQTVVWLVGSQAPAGRASHVEMATEGKQFLPHLVVVAPGSSVAFPNHDPFNHNVFSLSPEAPFDLGLYGRGEAKSITFRQPGTIQVYCNFHAQMRGIVFVVASGLVTQPGADGSFQLDGVPPGEYVLHAWHERSGEVQQPVTVTAEEPSAVTLTLDVRGYRLKPHLDKNGQSYYSREEGSRY